MSGRGRGISSYAGPTSLRGDSITDGWLKPGFVKEFCVRHLSSSATSNEQPINELHWEVDSDLEPKQIKQPRREGP